MLRYMLTIAILILFSNFQTYHERNKELEHRIIDAYFLYGLAGYINTTEEPAEKIQFVGRTLQLGNACVWTGANNIYCKGGQIDWSEFATLKEAEEDIKLRVWYLEQQGKNIVRDEEINVVFEGQPTVARRIVYEPAKFRGYGVLAVYYIAQEVRGRFVNCVMSNYIKSANDYKLASLLKQFVSIADLP